MIAAILGLFGIICGTAGFFALTFLLNGWALRLLWGWFIIPIFHLPPLSLLQAIGIGIVVSFLTKQYIPKKDDETEKMILHVIVSPLLAVAFGWIIHRLM